MNTVERITVIIKDLENGKRSPVAAADRVAGGCLLLPTNCEVKRLLLTASREDR